MILLTGGRGLLGTAFKQVLDHQNIEYMAPTSEELDITQPLDLSAYKPVSLIIHCAAYTAVDDAETNRDACFAVNVDGLKHLLLTGIPILHFSTDYVFPGTQEGTKEDAEREALNVYGESKLEAEKLLEASGDKIPRWWNIRTSWLYGKGGKNFVDTMRKLLTEKQELTVVDDQIGRLTNADDLAHFVVKHFVERQQQSGHYHLQGSGDAASWADIARLIAMYVGSEADVRGIKSGEYGAPAKRPNYSVLYNTKIDDQLPDWRESLKKYIAES